MKTRFRRLLRAALMGTGAVALALVAGLGHPAAQDTRESTKIDSLTAPAGEPGPYTALSEQTTPSIYSPKNAASDRMITIAHTLGLSEEQKRAIARGLGGGATRATTGQSSSAEPADALTIANTLPPALELRDFPASLARDVPVLQGYKYLPAGGKILIVEPSNRIVVGEIAQ